MEIALNGGTPVRSAMLVFGKPDILQDEIDEVIDSLRSGWISTGPKVQKFENMFRDYIGSKFALALNSCTAGLHLSMLTCGVHSNDEVITCPMTFAATANAIIHTGATPVFVDCKKDDMTIDPSIIESKITDRTKVIIPVHFAGHPADMGSIMEIAKKNQLTVVEDAAHSIEAEYQGEKIGSIGDLTVFSFYVTKNIVTAEGGMVTTNREDYAEKIQLYGLHGLSKGAWMRFSDSGFKHYQVVLPGYKYNMTDLQAAMGLHQLKRLEGNLKRREWIWDYYNDRFADLPLFVPNIARKNIRHARHLYTILIDLDNVSVDRDRIQVALYHENIGTGIHYIALHLHPYYQQTYGLRRGDFPNAEFISDRTLSLPLSTSLSDDDVEDVVNAVRKVLRYFTK